MISIIRKPEYLLLSFALLLWDVKISLINDNKIYGNFITRASQIQRGLPSGELQPKTAMHFEPPVVCGNRLKNHPQSNA